MTTNIFNCSGCDRKINPLIDKDRNERICSVCNTPFPSFQEPPRPKPTIVPNTPSTDIPSTDTPSTDIPSTDIPSTDMPSTDIPSTDIPSTDTPSTNILSTDTPSTDTPSTDIPSTDTPSTDTPSTDIPSTDIPSTDTPSTDTPSTDSSNEILITQGISNNLSALSKTRENFFDITKQVSTLIKKLKKIKNIQINIEKSINDLENGLKSIQKKNITINQIQNNVNNDINIFNKVAQSLNIKQNDVLNRYTQLRNDRNKIRDIQSELNDNLSNNFILLNKTSDFIQEQQASLETLNAKNENYEDNLAKLESSNKNLNDKLVSIKIDQNKIDDIYQNINKSQSNYAEKINEAEQNQNKLKDRSDDLLNSHNYLNDNISRLSSIVETYQPQLDLLKQIITRQKADLEYIEKESNIFSKKINAINPITDEKKISHSKLTHLLWNISGTSKEVLLNCPESEQKRHLSIGIALLIPTVLAFISGLGLLQNSLRDSPFILIFLAILWAFIIFLIDIALIISYRKKSNFTKGIMQILPRIFLSFVIAISVVHPTILYIESKNIKTYTTTMLDNEFKTECSNYNYTENNTALVPTNNCGILTDEISTLKQNIEHNDKEITDWKNFAEKERTSTSKIEIKPPYKSHFFNSTFRIKISGKPSKDDKKAPNESFYLAQAKKIEEVNTNFKEQFKCINVFQADTSKAKSEQVRCQSIKETIDSLKDHPTSSLLEQALLNMIFYKSNHSLNYFANKNVKSSELDIDYAKLTKYAALALVLFFIDILAVMIKINSNGIYEQKVTYNESLSKIKFLIREHMNFINFFFRKEFELKNSMNKEKIAQDIQDKIIIQNDKIFSNFLEQNTKNIINSK
jgi:hypothetical protein